MIALKRSLGALVIAIPRPWDAPPTALARKHRDQSLTSA